MVEIGILGVFAAALLCCILAGRSILYALLLGYALFFGYGLWKKHPPRALLRMSLSGVRTVKTILAAYGLIGMVAAVWRACGTVPYIVYHAARAFSPCTILLATFLLCCLISFLTGTAFGAAATAGVICMTMATGMGVPPAYTGGAILAGAYFGDRCSPMSTSALLVSSLTRTELFSNIAGMVRTSLVPFLLSCGLYLLAGALLDAAPQTAPVQDVFAAHFTLHPVVLLPAAAMVALSLFRVNVKLTMGVSILIAAAAALWVQGVAPAALLRIALLGYQPEDPALSALLAGGGVVSMLNVFAIVCISSCYAGIFRGTGFLDGLRGPVRALCARATPFGGVLAAALAASLVACNQTLTIILTHQLCEDAEPDGRTLASHLENTAVVVAPLIPWSIAGAAPLQALGAPRASVLAAWYLYLIPLWNLGLTLYRQRAARRAPSA